MSAPLVGALAVSGSTGRHHFQKGAEAMIDQQALSSLENLHRLKTEGIITEDEFERSKERILFGSKPALSIGRPTVEGLGSDVLAWLILPLRRYTDFKGRSGRKEFWLFQLVPTGIVLSMLLVSVMSTDDYGDFSGVGVAAIVIGILALLAIAVPQLALEVRRFHDQDLSGWYVLLNLIPYVGPIIVLVMMALPSTDGDNVFGPKPEA